MRECGVRKIEGKGGWGEGVEGDGAGVLGDVVSG